MFFKNILIYSFIVFILCVYLLIKYSDVVAYFKVHILKCNDCNECSKWFFDVAHLLSSCLETTGIFWYNCKMGLALILVGYKVHIHLSSLCCQMKSDYMHFFEISWYFINVHNSAIKGGLVNIQIVIVSQQFYFQHSSIKI